jgi:hypothetical protein
VSSPKVRAQKLRSACCFRCPRRCPDDIISLEFHSPGRRPAPGFVIILPRFNDMGDANPEETFACVVDVLNGHRPGYLHVVEDTIPVDRKADFFRRLRSAWKGTYVANGGYDAEQGERAVSDGSAMPWPMAGSSSRTRICPRA